MGVESSIGSKVLLRLVIIILAIISLEDWVPSVSSKQDFCEPAKCGDSLKDSPSWDGAGPCCPDKPLLLEPLWDDHVDYDNQSHALISEFEKTGNACFATPKYATRRPSVFVPDGHSYLAFLRNCSSFPIVDFPYPHSTCPSPGANRSYVALRDGPEDPPLKPFLACESHVIVPVKPAGPDSEEIGNDDHDGKWKRGLRLKWNLTSWDCVQCQKSGGNCGGSNGQFRCSSSSTDYPPPHERAQHGDLVMKVAIAASGVGIAIVILVVYSLRKKPLIRKHMAMMMGKRERSVAAQQIEGLSSLRRYTYKDIKRMTNSFQEKLGQGGYGYVYKGKLQDGQLVAVKLLKNLKGDGQEFVNEVASIIWTSHVNIVSLLGFCFEGSKKALIYEFMPNGSLEKFIFKSNTSEAN